MSDTSESRHHEYLRRAASTARDLLVNCDAERWEFFTKASTTREVEAAPNQLPRETVVEEVGVAIRTVRRGRTGFGAASGLGSDAARRAIDGALAVETALPLDPLPPGRLLGVADVAGCRSPSPRGWAAHATDLLARSVVEVSNGRLKLRRTLFQEGSFGWLLATADDFVAVHEDISASMVVELGAANDGGGIWREWLHLPRPETLDMSAVARQISDRALLVQGPLATDSGLANVILAPEMAARILAAMSPLLMANDEEHDPLPGLLDSSGRLASSSLSLLDDRLDPCAPITGPCDGEGLPARRTLLLEEGIPRHRLASFRDAVVFNETPRGGALRLSYRDYPVTGIANLRVDTENGLPSHELLRRAESALYLLRPLAPILLDAPGDNYRIVASGVWLDTTGVRGWHPVVELRGSLSLMLRRIDGVGTDLTWFQTDSGCVGAPTVLIRHQPVVG